MNLGSHCPAWSHIFKGLNWEEIQTLLSTVIKPSSGLLLNLESDPVPHVSPSDGSLLVGTSCVTTEWLVTGFWTTKCSQGDRMSGPSIITKTLSYSYSWVSSLSLYLCFNSSLSLSFLSRFISLSIFQSYIWNWESKCQCFELLCRGPIGENQGQQAGT